MIKVDSSNKAKQFKRARTVGSSSKVCEIGHMSTICLLAAHDCKNCVNLSLTLEGEVYLQEENDALMHALELAKF